jgi:hypothetical protein
VGEKQSLRMESLCEVMPGTNAKIEASEPALVVHACNLTTQEDLGSKPVQANSS